MEKSIPLQEKSPPLPASARQVYAALKEDNTLTYAGLMSKLGFANATIAKSIGHLVANGYIKRVGGRKSGHWQLLLTPIICQTGR